MKRKCYFTASFDGWKALNRAEDPHTNGSPDLWESEQRQEVEIGPLLPQPLPDLLSENLHPEDMSNLLLQARSDDSVGLESEQDDNGYSEMTNLAVDEFLAREERRELEARLARRLEEKEAGDMVLAYAGLSPRAHALHITALNDRLDGMPAELARQRAELRRKAAELAPHNLTEMIGSESPARGRS